MPASYIVAVVVVVVVAVAAVVVVIGFFCFGWEKSYSVSKLEFPPCHDNFELHTLLPP